MSTDTAERLAAEMLRRSEQTGAHLPAGETLGDRLNASQLLTDYRTRAAAQGDARVNGRVALLRADEVARALRLRAVDTSVITPDGNNGTAGGWLAGEGADRVVTLAPRVSRVPRLVPTVIADGDLVFDVEETSRATAAGGTDHGATAPVTTTLAVTQSNNVLRPFGTSATVAKGALEDRGVARMVVERFLRQTWLRALEAQILAGDGTANASTGTHNLLGIVNTTGVTTTARGSTSRVDALVTAVQAVQAAEWGLEEPPTVVLSPAAFYASTDTHDTANQPTALARALGAELGYAPRFVLSNALPAAGTVVVGDFNASALWLRGDLALLLSNQHLDYWTRGLVAALLTLDLAFKITAPAAFQILTGF